MSLKIRDVSYIDNIDVSKATLYFCHKFAFLYTVGRLEMYLEEIFEYDECTR